MRVAYCSPLPPQRTGVADYSAELLPALAAHCEPVLVLEPGMAPERALLSAFPTLPAGELGAALADGRCQAVLYQLGNNPDFHAGIYRSALAHPGLVVLHEFVLHHLVRDLTLYGGAPEAFVEAMRYSYGRSGEAAARRALATGVPVDAWTYPLFEPAVDAARALLVHNRATAERVLASRPQVRVEVVPHPLLGGERLLAASSGEARSRLGLPADVPLVATFGFLTASKRLPVLLRAFARLRAERPESRLLLVGELSPHWNASRLLDGELAAGVEALGRQPLERFLLYMQACDVAVNLRHPTAGETSGAVIRLLALGKPVVVTRGGAFDEIPDGCCAKVEVGDAEEEVLLAYLRALVGDSDLRQRMGDNARRHVLEHHTLAAAARGYAELLRRMVEEGWQPPVVRPPLAPYPPEDLTSELVRVVAADAYDLGFDEEEPGLAAVASALVELGLDGEPAR
jgi:glycosyltransferase involved in cell wall biosynthesis